VEKNVEVNCKGDAATIHGDYIGKGGGGGENLTGYTPKPIARNLGNDRLNHDIGGKEFYFMSGWDEELHEQDLKRFRGINVGQKGEVQREKGFYDFI